MKLTVPDLQFAEPASTVLAAYNGFFTWYAQSRPDQEKIKIKPQARACSNSEVFIQPVELESGSFDFDAVFVVCRGPNITYINK